MASEPQPPPREEKDKGGDVGQEKGLGEEKGGDLGVEKKGDLGVEKADVGFEPKKKRVTKQGFFKDDSDI